MINLAMALKPTIYKLKIALADMNREFYDSINLTIALHPSENITRMMARILAFCINAQENLTFTKGLSVIDEPDIWVKTLDDQIKLWIDMGEPAADRIKKASRLSPQVKVYSFNSKSDTWWQQTKAKTASFDNVQFYQLDWSQIQDLAIVEKRNMDWSVTISGDTIYISDDKHNSEVVIRSLE